MNTRNVLLGMLVAVFITIGIAGCSKSENQLPPKPDGDVDSVSDADLDDLDEADIEDGTDLVSELEDADTDKLQDIEQDDATDASDPDTDLDVDAPDAEQEEQACTCVRHCISVDPHALNFGAVLPGDVKKKRLQISNTGVDAAVIYQIRLSTETSNEFSITENPAAAGTLVLSPRQTVEVEVSYSPESPEPDFGNLIISTNDECTANFVIELTSGAKGEALLEVEPSNIEFGQLLESQIPASKNFTVRCLPKQSDDTMPLTVTSIELDSSSDACFILDLPEECSVPIVLYPHEEVHCGIKFNPTDLGQFSGKINIEAEDGIQPTQTAEIALSGALVAASVSVDPDRIDFGYVITGTTHQKTLRITNLGTAPLHISAIQLVMQDSPFELQFDQGILSSPISQQGSIDITVVYNPDTPNTTDLNTIVIMHDAAGGMEQVFVSGMNFETCPPGFEENTQDGTCEPHCTPGDKFCAGNGFRVCLEDGESLSEIFECPEGTYCEDGECVQQVCPPGTLSCSDDNKKVLRCNEIGSAWEEFVICESGDVPCRESFCDDSEGNAHCVDNPLTGTPCDDHDWCTIDDTCQNGICTGTRRDCKDDNTCTDDYCDSDREMCMHPPKDENAICDDGNPCTINDHCTSGARCVGGGNRECNDNNPCTTDSCDPNTEDGCVFTPNPGAICDDGNPCTADDYCNDEGVCVGGTSPDCDDDNPCTSDYCDSSYGCRNTPLSGIPCDDGDPCTMNTVCQSGYCGGGDPITCDDGDPCTFDHCVSSQGGCVSEPIEGAYCNDGNACTSNDRCVQTESGIVCQGAEKDCDDNNPCTRDWCDSELGCQHENLDGTSCDDGNPCTVGDYCFGGFCKPGEGPDCNDGNPCTRDTCDPATGECSNPPLSAGSPCEDGNACTLNDYCDGNGTCVPGSDPECDDDNPCTEDLCNPETGCVNTPLTGTSCDDGDPCTLVDQCYNGVCRGSELDSCDDGNPCTTDSCLSGIGCQHQNRSGTCDDGNACTINDSCGTHDGEWNCKGTEINPSIYCNDNNDCTLDTCDPASGCQHSPQVGNSCNDHDACTINDVCVAVGDSAECQGQAVDPATYCDDNNECTNDYCDSSLGCKHSNKQDGYPCDDENACTGTPGNPDHCSNGTCQPGAPVVCNDDNICTDDSCNPSTGCVFTPVAGRSCDDGDPCSLNDTCDSDGVCVAGTDTRDCEDGNPCTTNWCDASDPRAANNGCVTENLPNGTSCDRDGDICTIDECWSVQCIFVENRNCDDGNECTENWCDQDDSRADEYGCVLENSPTTKPCTEDGNQCTYDLCDGSGHCGHPYKPTSESCDDEQFCTVSDHCDGAGGCVGGENRDCTGQCLTGVCKESEDVCEPVADYTPCDDGNANTIEDACINGQCVGSTTWYGPGECPGFSDMVKVPGTNWCIDKWEASMMETSNCGGTQYGVDSDDYPDGFPDDVDKPMGGSDQTTPVYACALENHEPSRYMTYWQAKKACENMGKVICPADIWQDACHHGDSSWSYPYGNSYHGNYCNGTDYGSGAPISTGDATSCTSDYGHFDMSGNVDEWTSGTCGAWGASRRVFGGYFGSGEDDLKCSSNSCESRSTSNDHIGVRCCKSF